MILFVKKQTSSTLKKGEMMRWNEINFELNWVVTVKNGGDYYSKMISFVIISLLGTIANVCFWGGGESGI